MSLSTPFLCCQDALDFCLRLSQGRLQQNSVALNAALAVLEAKEQWRLVLQACEAGDSKICLHNFAFRKRQGTLSRFEGNYVFEHSGRSQDACVYLNVIFLVDSRHGRIAHFGYVRCQKFKLGWRLQPFNNVPHWGDAQCRCNWVWFRPVSLQPVQPMAGGWDGRKWLESWGCDGWIKDSEI